MKIIKVGYWASEKEPNLPDPTKLPKIDPTVKWFVLQYLSKGTVHIRWKGPSFCRFNCGVGGLQMGTCCMTDGTYQWPEGLSHYVSEHNVSLPQDFITHIMKNSNKR